MRYYFTPTSMARIEKVDNTAHWQGGSSHFTGGTRKWDNHLENSLTVFPAKVKYTPILWPDNFTPSFLHQKNKKVWLSMEDGARENFLGDENVLSLDWDRVI